MTKTQQVIFQKYCDEPERRVTKRRPGDDSRGIEEEAKRIAHTTQSDRQKRSGKNSERRYCERSGSGEEFQTNGEKSAHGTGQGRACCEMRLDAWQKNIETKACDRTVRARQFHGGQRCFGEIITETLCGGLRGSKRDD